MVETKYGKYIVTEKKSRVNKPKWETWPDPKSVVPVIMMDSDVVEGTPIFRCVWFLPTEKGTPDEGVFNESHTHDFDEILTFFGTDPKNPQDLGAEIALWLGDEKHIITESCVIFIPRGLAHKLVNLRIDRPVMHQMTATTKKYGGTVV